MTTFTVIPAAGNPKLSLFPNTFDPMIPINGIPAIKHIINTVNERRDGTVIVVLNSRDEKSREYLSFFRQYNVKIKVAANKFKGIGDSIYTALDAMDDGVDQVIINLGDTIYTSTDASKGDFVLVSKKEDLEPSNWDYILDDGKTFVEKPVSYQGGSVTCGVYGFNDVKALKDVFSGRQQGEFIYITDVLEAYARTRPFALIEERNNWFDLGHLDGFHAAKIEFLRMRTFNNMKYDAFKGVITKRSTNREKIFWEANWYLNLPEDLKIFAPRLLDYNFAEHDTYYSIEFYGYPSLSDLRLYANLGEEQWKFVIKKLLAFIKHLHDTYKITMVKKSLNLVYVEKTLDRIAALLLDPLFKDLHDNHDTIVINGVAFPNYLQRMNRERLTWIGDQLFSASRCSIIHGDLCFSNILYDIHSGIFKLIDPRGNFGGVGIFGDLNYDLAKLRHSIHGNYEGIIADQFVVKKDMNTFDYTTLHGEDASLVAFFDKSLERAGYDVKIVKLIEALHFLTMIPLHSDSRGRQTMMFLKSIELFDQVKEHFCADT
ncbi:MAG: hypothetical protein JW839_13285 [Candidatus Lokiarchaeota archaeon]|nr:hypothetical protein [Candidatus Lokiarchaeota archaeon]